VTVRPRKNQPRPSPSHRGRHSIGSSTVQWHGTYELLLKLTELDEMANALRATGGHE
jgi:hypothetical protein